MRQVSWATTLSRDFAEAEGFEPPTFGFGDRHSTNCARPRSLCLQRTMLPSLRWRDSNPRSRMAADLQSALVAAGEHLILLLWNLVESNHVLRIFSPAHTPSLPKFLWRRLRDSNPWGVLPPSGFQDQCNRPTLPNLQLAEAEGFEPPKPFGFTR